MAGQTVVVSVLADTGRFTRAFKGVASGVGKIAAGAAAGLAVAGVALAKLAKDSIESASNLQQSSGAVDAVFKKQAASVHKWAKSAWKDLGLSENAYSNAASLIGSQLKNMGVPMSGLGKQTNSLIKKGADLAAQFGGTTADAVEALSALLRGETDPIEKYGVSIKEVDIKAQMAADGTAKLAGAQGKAARTAAIMTLLNKQTADALGANAREAMTWEGVTQRLAGWWDNLKAKLGTPMIKVLAALVAKFTAFSDQLIKTTQFTAFLDWLNKVGDGLASSAGPASNLAGQALTLVRSFTPLGILFRAVQPILPQLASSLASLGGTLSTSLAAILPTITPLLDQLAAVLGSLIASALPPIVQLVGALAAVLVQLVPPIAAVVSELLGALAPVLVQLGPVLAVVANVIGSVLAAVLPVVTALIRGVSATIAALLPVLEPIISAVMEVVTALSPILTLLGQLIGAILPPLIDLSTALTTALISGAVPAVRFVAAVITVLARALGDLIGWLVSTLTASTNAANGVTDGWGKVKAFLSTFGSKIAAVFAGAGKWLIDAGRQLLAGLWNGINDKVSWLKGQIGGAMDGVINWVKDKFQIHSPSRVFREIGRMLPAGLAVGVTDTTDRAVSALGKMITAINKAATKATKHAARAATATLKAQQKTTKALWKADDLTSARTIAAALSANGKWTATASRQMKSATLTDIGRARGALTEEIKAQTAVLKDLIDQHAQLRDQVAANVTSSLDLGSTLKERSNGTFSASFTKMSAQVAGLKEKALALAGKMRQLVAKGLPAGLVQQIAALGLDKAGAVADAFLTATDTDVSSYVADWTTFNQTATDIGTTLADQMYGAGIAAQQGIINGLLADRDKLTKAAEQIADAIEKTIKKKLKIHSPSRVMSGIARNIIAGLRLVLGDTSGVTADMVKLSSAVSSNFDPTLTATSSQASNAAAGSVTFNITLNGVLDGREGVARLRELFTTDARLRGVIGLNDRVLA